MAGWVGDLEGGGLGVVEEDSGGLDAAWLREAATETDTHNIAKSIAGPRISFLFFDNPLNTLNARLWH